ncbi:hypothetical protein GmHk_09G025125 [Glycine max]|nr:hypothetical protein GmHk_09G025125 [Glycine max]
MLKAYFLYIITAHINGKQCGKKISRCKLALRGNDIGGIVFSNEIKSFSINARFCNPMISVFMTCKYASPTTTTLPVVIIPIPTSETSLEYVV